MKERNCENCIHHTADGCSSWDCEFETKDLISRADAIDAVAQEWLSEASAESPYVNDDDIGAYRTLAENLFKDVPSAELTIQTPQTYGKSINPSNAEVLEDFISRADAIDAIDDAIDADSPQWAILRTKIGFLPSADTVSREFYQDAVKANIRILMENRELKEQIESAEAEKVVRCRDCKHKYVSGNGTTQYYVCDFMDAQYEDDGFCHHGERREE